MNELSRTLVFVGVAVVSAFAGYFTLPRSAEINVQALAGQQLFDDFKDPTAAANLEIVKFDEKLGKLESFQVGKSNGQWVIPSHDDYPADAEKQLRDAAVSLLDLKSIDVVSQLPADFSVYGVLEPSKEKLKVGDEGVGQLVALKDERGSDLVRLIVGKEAKGGKDLRFVRIPSQDVTYVVKFNPEHLKTKFEDWIEKDLLKLNGWDMAKVTLKDYSMVLQQGLGGLGVDYQPRMDAAVAFEDNKWKLEQLTMYGKGAKPVPAELGELEELNEQKLNDLKFAVDDLKIVDVVRKPKGLGASLSTDENFLSDKEGMQSLIALGFIPTRRSKDNPVEIFASNGEAIITMKDGVEYVLRFGNIAESAKSAEEGKLNRYLFVTTRLSETQLPKPMLEPEPAGPEVKPEAKPAEGENKSADGKSADAKAENPPAESDAQRAERERIRKENQRKTDEYNEKKKKATARVAELNARFANWYYVVAEDTYKKIHLGRNDIVKEGAKAKEEGFGVDAFRELQKQGLKK